MTEFLKEWGPLGTLVSALTAVILLLMNAKVIRTQTRVTKVSMFNSIRERIQDKRFKKKLEDEDQEALWDEEYFNEFEWLAFLVRNKELPFDLIEGHLGPVILNLNGSVYPRLKGRGKDHPRTFEDFEWLVQELRKRQGLGQSQAMTWIQRLRIRFR